MWTKVWTTDLGVIVHAQRIGAQGLDGFVDNVDNLLPLPLKYISI